MKKRILLKSAIIFVFSIKVFLLNAQEYIPDVSYDSAFQLQLNYFNELANQQDTDLIDVPGFKHFSIWARDYATMLDDEGTLGSYGKAIESYYSDNTDIEGDFELTWQYNAPDSLWRNLLNNTGNTNSGQGLIISLWVNPADTQHILAGGQYTGGLWGTTDGGDKWTNLTENYREIQGIHSIFVNPLDTLNIYVTSTFDADGPRGYSNGVYFTEDGGTTWELEDCGGLYTKPRGIDYSPRVFLKNPLNDSIQYLLTPYRLYVTKDKWEHSDTIIHKFGVDYNPNGFYSVWLAKRFLNYMIFDPSSYDTLYVTGPEAYRVTYYNGTFETLNITSAISIINDVHTPEVIKVDAVDTKPDNIYFSFIDADDNIYISKYDQKENSYITKYVFENTIGAHFLQCQVSPVNPDYFIIGGISPKCVSFNDLHWKSLGSTHGFHNDIRICEWTNANFALFGTDGGITKFYDVNPYSVNYNNFKYIANDGDSGIRNLQVRGLDVSRYGPETMGIGTEHDAFILKKDGIFYRTFSGGDQESVLINPDDFKKIYVVQYGHDGLEYSDHQGEFPHEFYSGYDNDIFYPPILFFRPNNTRVLYAGSDSVIWEFDTQNIYNDPVIHYLPDDGLPETNYGFRNITETGVNDDLEDLFFIATNRYWMSWEGWNCSAGGNPHINALFKVVIEPDGLLTFTSLSQNSYIDDGLCGGPISGIAVEVNENDTIVYVSFGGTSTSTDPYKNKKVYKSEDLGVTWDTMATGLPDSIPVNDIKYHRESGMLFLANDVGVYYYDKEEDTWKNITGDLPPMACKMIRFSFLRNKILVGTYAKGVWEADIPCNYNLNPLTISTSKTWNCSVPLHSDLIIEPGVTLTIKKEVYVNPSAKIIVKRGARLLVDGGKITSACGNLWKGVEVWGTNNQPQTQQYQGIVEIINGGTIENAVCGIQTIKMALPEGEFEFPDYNYTGGIILCDDAIFKNNQTAVKFWNYNHSPSVSYFRECEFVTNNDLLEGTEVDCFIEMSGISGVHILGNSFTDEHTFVEPVELTSGIYANNSQFYVQPQAGQQNVFTGLYYGIKALATNPITIIEIENNQFTNNLRSVYLSATNNAHVNLNVFNPWTELLMDPSESYCMYLDHCTGYQVEQNTFTNEVGTHKGIGLIVNQSGYVNNMVYLNYFNNLLYGAIAQNENRNNAGTLGLQFKCNEFIENASDLSVTYQPPKTKSIGIAAIQGSSLPSPSAPAGNLFSWTGPLGNPTDINNEANHFTYYYHVNPLFHLEPKYYSTFTVTKQPNYGAPYNDQSCPPDFEGGGSGGGSRETMALAEQKADSLQEIISALEDGGNTLELKEDVEWSIPPESMEVYNKLMSNSPYLTDTVVGEAIEKEDVLANAMIRDVMVANPQSAKDDELIEKLDERGDPVPEYMLGEILQGRSLVSVYEELQSKLSFYTLQRSTAYHTLVTSYLNDTVNPDASTDSLAALFGSEQTPEAKYSLAFLSIEHGDWSTGIDILNQVPSLFTLTDEQQAEQQYLVELCALLAGLNGTLPDSAQLNELKSIESANAGIGSAYSRNLLLALDETEYSEPVILPGMLKSSEAAKYEQYLQSARDMKYLEVFPNPSHDHVIISWKVENTSSDVKIVITENTGKNISEIAVNSSENQQVFDTRKLKPGVYIATLFVNGKQTDSTKFTLIK